MQVSYRKLVKPKHSSYYLLQSASDVTPKYYYSITNKMNQSIYSIIIPIIGYFCIVQTRK